MNQVPGLSKLRRTMKPASIVFAAIFTVIIFSAGKSIARKPDVIAYYTGDGTTINKYPVEKLTHIIYSFLHLKGDTISFHNDTQRMVLHQLAGLKTTYPRLKIMVSLGGWGGCQTCSPVFAYDSARKNFAASVVRVLKDYNVDGIDIDWEYPAIEGYPGHPWSLQDKENFTALLKELRRQMGRRYELSFAAGGFNHFLTDAVDWKAIMPKVTRVNLMTYDLINGYSKTTGHHTALFSRDEQSESTDNCVQYLLSHHVKARKLVIGAAFYARVWENVADTSKGLYQQGSFKYGVDFKQFTTKLSADSGWVHYWDEVAQAPYSYNPVLKHFATYDDERSLEAKVNYVRKYKLGGIMFWELMNDAYTNGRLDAIYKALQ